jgi:hypothetical protein
MADFSRGNPPLPTIPDAITHLAATYSLGSFSKVYRAHYQDRTRAMLIGCPLLILGPVVLCLGAIALFTLSYGISDALGLRGSTNAPQFIAYGIFLVVMGIVARVAIPAAWRINASGTVVYLFQNGIIYSKGKHPTLLHWQQITSGKMDQTSRVTPERLVLKTVDRRVITIHTLADIHELARRIQQAIAQGQQARQ